MAASLHDAAHRPAVVVLTSATDDEHLVRAMQAGATSYLLKTAPAEDVTAAVRDAAAGTASLSPELLTRLTQALRRSSSPDPLSPARTRRTPADRPRPQQPADRPGPGDRRANCQDPRPKHPHQTHPARPRPGGDLRPPPPNRNPRTPTVTVRGFRDPHRQIL